MRHQQNLLRAIFQDPVSGNMHWRDIESLLHHLGAKIEPNHGARFRVTLNGIEDMIHHPHHGGVCNKQEIKHIREFLARAGVSPSQYEAERKKAREAD